MADKMTERRACERFVVLGATACYKKEVFFFKKDFTDDCYPVFDISRGGLLLACPDFLKIGTKISVKIIIPDDETPLVIKGKVIRSGLNPEKSYRYQIGIQFAPYGAKKGENSSEALARIHAWEEKSKKS